MRHVLGHVFSFLRFFLRTLLLRWFPHRREGSLCCVAWRTLPARTCTCLPRATGDEHTTGEERALCSWGNRLSPEKTRGGGRYSETIPFREQEVSLRWDKIAGRLSGLLIPRCPGSLLKLTWARSVSFVVPIRQVQPKCFAGDLR